MNFYAGTLGQLVIVQVFVLTIWLKVLFAAISTRHNGQNLEQRRLLLTSAGLVVNSVAVGGIMAYRIYELITGHWPFVWGIVAFYVMLAISGFLFLISASIGTNLRLLKAFLITTATWTTFVVYMNV